MEVVINKQNIKEVKIPFSEVNNMFDDLGFESLSNDWDIKKAGKRIAEKIELKFNIRTKKEWSVNYSINETEKCFLFIAKLVH